MYFIIQTSGISLKLVFVNDSSSLTSNAFMTIARNSALVIGLFGLNVQSSYHLRIHFSTNSRISSLANESSISLNLDFQPVTDVDPELVVTEPFQELEAPELESEDEFVRASHFQSYEFHDLSQFVHVSTNSQPPPQPPPPPPPLDTVVARVVELKLQTCVVQTEIVAVTVVELAGELVSCSLTVSQLLIVHVVDSAPLLIDINQFATVTLAHVFVHVAVRVSDVSTALRPLHVKEAKERVFGIVSTRSNEAKKLRWSVLNVHILFESTVHELSGVLSCQVVPSVDLIKLSTCHELLDGTEILSVNSHQFAKMDTQLSHHTLTVWSTDHTAQLQKLELISQLISHALASQAVQLLTSVGAKIIQFQLPHSMLREVIHDRDSDPVIEFGSAGLELIRIFVQFSCNDPQLGIVAPATFVDQVSATLHPDSDIGEDAVANDPVDVAVFPALSIKLKLNP